MFSVMLRLVASIELMLVILEGCIPLSAKFLPSEARTSHRLAFYSALVSSLVSGRNAINGYVNGEEKVTILRNLRSAALRRGKRLTIIRLL